MAVRESGSERGRGGGGGVVDGMGWDYKRELG